MRAGATALALAAAVVCVASAAARRRRHELQWLRATNDPCLLPAVDDPHFDAICAEYLKKRYVCAPSGTLALSFGATAQLEGALAGDAAYCRYDALHNRAFRLPIGDQLVLRRADAAKTRHQRKRPNQHRKKLKASTAPLLRPMDRRPLIGITIVEQLDPALPTEHCSLTLQAPPTMPNLLQFYANASRARWSANGCQTDIAILAVGVADPTDSKGIPILMIQVSLSPKFDAILGASLAEMTKKINGERWSIESIDSQLNNVVACLFRLLNERYPKAAPKKLHRIPTWALLVFGLCFLLTCCAACLGNWVNDTNGRRSPANSDGKSDKRRRWKAGFSGGMWAA